MSRNFLAFISALAFWLAFRFLARSIFFSSWILIFTVFSHFFSASRLLLLCWSHWNKLPKPPMSSASILLFFKVSLLSLAHICKLWVAFAVILAALIALLADLAGLAALLLDIADLAVTIALLLTAFALALSHLAVFLARLTKYAWEHH